MYFILVAFVYDVMCAFTFGNVKPKYLEGRRVKMKLTRQENAIFLKK